MILSRERGEEPGGAGITRQAQGLPGATEPAFHFRTDRAVPDAPPQLINEHEIQFVPAVPANLLSEQAGAYPQRDRRLNHLLALINPATKKLPPFLYPVERIKRIALFENNETTMSMYRLGLVEKLERYLSLSLTRLRAPPALRISISRGFR
jgi:hypothetical protein